MSKVLASAEIYHQNSRPDRIAEWAETRRALNDVVADARPRLEKFRTDLDESVEPRDNLALRAIISEIYREKIGKTIKQPTTDMVCMSAWAMVSSPELVAVIAATTSGRTARMLARYRPDIPIFGATHDDENRRELLLCYGIRPVNIGLGANCSEDLYKAAIDSLKKEGCLRRRSYDRTGRDLVLMVSGEPFGDPGSTDQMKLVPLRPRDLEVSSQWMRSKARQ
jgi:pyruvate kinase